MKHRFLMTFHRMFKPNYYLVRTVKSNKTVSQGYRECAKFAFLKHIVRGKAWFFTIKLLS